MYQRLEVIGNVGKEPEVREVGDSKVANFSIAATERGYTTKSGKEVPEHTEWFNCEVWGGLANVVEKFVHKGDRLMLEGKLRTRSYDKDGEKRYVTDFKVSNLLMLSNREQPQSPQGGETEQPEPHDDLPF